MTDLVIRPLEHSDHATWRRLWTGYLEFYGTFVSDEVYETTWTRLFDDGPFEPKGFLAVADGRGVGLVHYMMHRTCWAVADNCYLQDLYAEPEMRGRGVGRALIEAVYREADRRGANSVYWLTQDHNKVARRLYDRIARDTGFVRYSRP